MTLERWQKLSPRDKLLIIGSEIMRAKIWQNKDRDKFLSAAERTLDLIDLSLKNYRNEQNPYVFLWLRQEMPDFTLE